MYNTLYMKWDNFEDSRKGFTIVEVVLVLAITGLIFMGAVNGVGTAIARQRFNDSTQEVAQKLREAYNSVSRVQVTERSDGDSGSCVYTNPGKLGAIEETQRGRTDCNVYGVAIILGANNGNLFQTTSLIGQDIGYYRKNLIKTDSRIKDNADVDKKLMAMSDSRLLGELNVNNYFYETSAGGVRTSCNITEILENKNISWEARIEAPSGAPAKSAIVIVRSPRDGTIHTFYRSLSSVSIPDYRALTPTGTTCGTEDIDISAILRDETSETKDIFLCVDSDDVSITTKRRRTIKIAADGHSATAVELIDVDSDGDENLCAKCDDNPGAPGCV